MKTRGGFTVEFKAKVALELTGPSNGVRPFSRIIIPLCSSRPWEDLNAHRGSRRPNPGDHQQKCHRQQRHGRGVVSETFPSPQFFWPTKNSVWTANHTDVRGSNICNLLFEIGSITKVFTSRLFYKNYGSTIGECMPAISLPDSVSSLSIANIGSYASGFPQDNGHPSDPRGVFCPDSALGSLEALINWFNNGCSGHTSWICHQGDCYTYSNLAWSLFAIAALNPTNTDADVYSIYTGPLKGLCYGLGMSGPTALYLPSQVGNGMACGYKDGQPFAVGEDYQPSPPMHFGAGGIVSNIEDMLQWLRYNMGQIVISDQSMLAAEQTPNSPLNQCGTTTGSCGSGSQGPTTGQGWFFPRIGGQSGRVLAKDGGVHGFSSWMGFETWTAGSPSQNGVVVLGAGENAPTAGLDIMAKLLNADIEAIERGAIGFSSAALR